VSLSEIIASVIAFAILGVIVAAANYADRERHTGMRRAVIVSLVLINLRIGMLDGFMQVAVVSLSDSGTTDADLPEPAAAWGGLVSSAVLAAAVTAILFRSVRERLTGIFPAYRGEDNRRPGFDPVDLHPVETTERSPMLNPDPGGTPLFPQMLNYYTSDSAASLSLVPAQRSPALAVDVDRARDEGPNGYFVRGFNPASTVHMVALAFCIYLLGTQFVTFILGGGLEGVAESFSEGISAADLLVNALPQVIIPFIGVGLMLRRTWPQALRRLGLGMPSMEGIAVASGLVIGLLIFVAMVVAVWSGLVSEETFQEQTEASEALSESISTIGMAFLLAATAAISEEIAFRGAMQPVFGFWPTAIVFAATHIQYTLTPASLIILGVAIGFGWLRMRYNTTVSIFAHFIYNFIPLSIAVAMPEETAAWFLRLF
jgi:hypothetical protein